MVHLLPKKLVESVLQMPEDVATQLAELPLLLVRVDESDEKIIAGLEAMSRDYKRMMSNRAFEDFEPQTRTRLMPTIDKRRGGGSSDPGVPRRRASGPGFSAGSLRKRVTAATHYATLVTKRDPHADDPRVTVGRKADNDIVLAHKTVSSVHAFLDSDERNCVFLTDNGSTNGTRINGHRAAANVTTPVNEGDFLTFGDVETMLCELSTLRAMLLAK